MMEEQALRVEEEKHNIKKQMYEDLEWREHLHRQHRVLKPKMTDEFKQDEDKQQYVKLYQDEGQLT